jgi:prepilin-type N-terminal cleavage/methylation domain-containing protein
MRTWRFSYYLSIIELTMNKKNIRQGFTLIELLLVIAVIGILGSIVVGTVANAR